MNILFLTIAYPLKNQGSNIYSDLMEDFSDNGHSVNVVCSLEKRHNRKTSSETINGVNILRVKSGNLTENKNLISKGLATILFQKQAEIELNKRLLKLDFDLIIYSTPPITFSRLVKKLKRKNNAKTYLLLKDIFPQNAVDLGLFKKHSLIWKYFRRKENRLYQVSDFIGCMSEANVSYILKHNPELINKTVEVCPNSIIVKPILAKDNKKNIRQEYDLPPDAVVCIYGGNLGISQGISFLIEIIKENSSNTNVFFLIVGKGTAYESLKNEIENGNFSNVKLIPHLQQKKFRQLTNACDIGMIFLNPKFSIPNFPSRLLAYLDVGLPVIAATDSATDIGKTIKENQCGFGVLSGDLENFQNKLDILISNLVLRNNMGKNGRQLLERDYSTTKSYAIIMNHFKNNQKKSKGSNVFG